MAAKLWEWTNAAVIAVTDGDTVVARLTRDIGFEATVTFPWKLRLNRINAPSAKSMAGKAAIDALEIMVLGQELHIQTLRTYKYGGGDRPEYMAEITLADGTNVSDALVKSHHAVYWDGTGPRPSDEG